MQTVFRSSPDHRAAGAKIQALEALRYDRECRQCKSRFICWSYSSSGVLDFLDAGETLSMITATVDDGHGGIVNAQPFSVTIGGTNSPPVVWTPDGSFSKAAPATRQATKLQAASVSLMRLISDRPTVYSGVQLTRLPQRRCKHDQLPFLPAKFAFSVLPFGWRSSPNSNNGSVTWTYRHTDSASDFLAAGDTLADLHCNR